MELTTWIQDRPEPLAGSPFTDPQPLCEELHYFVVLADGVAVACQSFYKRGTRWWVDDLFIVESHRGTDVAKVLREGTFRAVAERADAFYAWIKFTVATPEKVLQGVRPGPEGLKIELVKCVKGAAKYRYDVSALRPVRATG